MRKGKNVMLETKILEVSEESKNRIIQDYQYFGWHVLSTQKIDYTTTYRTGGGNARDGYHFTVHNDRTAYYSITFQRDSEIKNYDELNRLFADYDSLDSKYQLIKNYSSQKLPGSAIALIILAPIIALIFNIIALVLFANEVAVAGAILMLIGDGLTALFVILAVKNIKKTRNYNAMKNAENHKKKQELISQMNEITAKAKTLAK